jgi:hypothetical protein
MNAKTWWSSVVCALLLAACGGGGDDNNNTDPQPQSGLWSDVKTWGGTRLPEAGEVVVIPAGSEIVLDVDPPALGGLIIEGELRVAPRDLQLKTGYISVAGHLEIGSASQPFIHQAEITLTGAPEASVLGVSSRGIILNGGTVEMVGQAPAVTWTQINQHADAGSTALTLKQAVAWKSGDVVTIAPTDYYGVSSTERTTLASASAGDKLQLSNALAEFHWGRLQYVTRTGMSLSPDPGFRPSWTNGLWWPI